MCSFGDFVLSAPYGISIAEALPVDLEEVKFDKLGFGAPIAHQCIKTFQHRLSQFHSISVEDNGPGSLIEGHFAHRLDNVDLEQVLLEQAFPECDVKARLGKAFASFSRRFVKCCL